MQKATLPKPYYEDEAVTIYHGDCREFLPNVEADVLITDPDYGVGMAYGEEALATGEADALLVSVLSDVRIRSGHGLIFWSGSWGRLSAIDSLVQSGGWKIKHFGVWYKPNGAGASGNGLARRFETWFWIVRSNAPKKRSEWDRLPDCIDVSRIHRRMLEGTKHPSQKPEELMRRFVRFFSLPGDVIFDPFMGSGSTLRAAKDLRRKAIGVELQQAYCEMAVRRMAQGVLV
jgi:site-specific DNA-methyltransferase (adenine-specific)